jgi:hypothetical protein
MIVRKTVDAFITDAIENGNKKCFAHDSGNVYRSLSPALDQTTVTNVLNYGHDGTDFHVFKYLSVGSTGQDETVVLK